MKVGDCAEVSRTFSMNDLQAYAELSGHVASAERVPDAMIGESLTAQVEITCLRPDKQLADLSTTCRGADGRLIASGRALVYTGDVALKSCRHELKDIDLAAARQGCDTEPESSSQES